MFERCNERARKVVALADARAGGGTMTTGHLLLGLLDEGGGLAYRVLTELGVTAERAAASASCGIASSEPGTRRRLLAPIRRERLVTETLTNASDYAVREAIGFGHNYVGTEHLLLALLRADGDGAVVLAALGVRDDVRAAVIRHLKGAPEAQAAEAEAPAEQRTYTVEVGCRNCDRDYRSLSIPFGTPVSEHPCEHCGVKALELHP